MEELEQGDWPSRAERMAAWANEHWAALLGGSLASIIGGLMAAVGFGLITPAQRLDAMQRTWAVGDSTRGAEIKALTGRVDIIYSRQDTVVVLLNKLVLFSCLDRQVIQLVLTQLECSEVIRAYTPFQGSTLRRGRR